MLASGNFVFRASSSSVIHESNCAASSIAPRTTSNCVGACSHPSGSLLLRTSFIFPPDVCFLP
jgi:hypothetical protein